MKNINVIGILLSVFLLIPSISNVYAASWSPYQPAANTYFVIQSKSNPKLRLDVAGGVAKSDANIVSYQDNGGYNNQKFRFIPAGNGFYKIETALEKNKFLSIHYSGKKDRTNIKLNHPVGKNQLFKLEKNAAGDIRFTSVLGSNLHIGLDDNKGTINIALRVGDKGNKTLFKLIPTQRKMKKLKSIFTRNNVDSSKVKTKVKETVKDNVICSSQVIDAAKTVDINYVTDNNSGKIIYPGAMIYAQDLEDGSYNVITAARNPITLVTDLRMIKEKPSIDVINPNLDTVFNAMSTLLGQKAAKPDTETGFSVESVYSQKHMSLALGGRFSRAGISISGNADFAKNISKNYLMAKFKQKFYTIRVKQKTSNTLFKNPHDADKIFNGNKIPLYVSAVNYGRAAYFFLETSANTKDAKAFLEASYNGLGTQAEATVKANFNKFVKKSNMRVLYVGGTAKITSKGIKSFAAFKKAIEKDSSFNKNRNFRPISYELSFAKDGKTAKAAITTTYTKRECKKATGTIAVELKNITVIKVGSNEGGDLDLFENIDVFLYKDGKVIERRSVKFASEDYYINVDEGKSHPFKSNRKVLFKVKAGEESRYTIKLVSQIWDHNKSSSNDRMKGDTSYRADKANDITGSFEAGERSKRIRINFSISPVED